MDGNSFAIAAWSRQLERELPTVARGFDRIRESTAAAIAESLATRWIGWCVGDETDPRVRTSTRDEGRWIWPIVDYPLDTPNTARLIMADDLLARWLVGELPEETVVEELHTIVEALLRHRLSAGRSVRWPELLVRADDAGLLSPTEVKVLEVFNRTWRRELKHMGRVLTTEERKEAKRLLWSVLSIAENALGSAK
ncbi:MAG: hypothetical protein WEA29_09010 [Acidimicrobiia bacterium]